MNFIEIFLIAIALSMDAFAVALAKGLCMRKIEYGPCFIIALFFGVFQLIMPLIGWFLSSYFQEYIASSDTLGAWLVFGILSLLGAKMLYESCKYQSISCREKENCSLQELFVLAISTSIDALAVGISFALLSAHEILSASIVIGAVTFCLSFLGVLIGNKYGIFYGGKAEFFGGCILLAIACKALFSL